MATRKIRLPFNLIDLEHRHEKLISRRDFFHRMLRAIGVWCVLALCGLIIGMAGYCYFEGMSLPDAYVNAAMILSGMGPLGELKTTAGKIFAESYAIFSGLVIVIATSFVLAPIFHRVLHHFHVETGRMISCVPCARYAPAAGVVGQLMSGLGPAVKTSTFNLRVEQCSHFVLRWNFSFKSGTGHGRLSLITAPSLASIGD